MKYIRKKALIASIIEFFVFSFFSCLLIRMLFYVVILVFPVIAFMWTFWGFSVFTFITGIQIMSRYKISFAVLNFLAVSLSIVFLINSSKFVMNKTIHIFALTASVVVGILYVLTAILFIKKYWSPVKIKILRFFGKIPPETPLDIR